MVLKIPIRRKSRCWSLYGWMKLRLLGESSRSSPAEKKEKRNWTGRCSELCDVYRNSRSSPLWRWALFLIDDIMERKDGIAGVQIVKERIEDGANEKAALRFPITALSFASISIFPG